MCQKDTRTYKLNRCRLDLLLTVGSGLEVSTGLAATADTEVGTLRVGGSGVRLGGGTLEALVAADGRLSGVGVEFVAGVADDPADG